MYLQKVISEKLRKHNSSLLASCSSMRKIAGSGTCSISQRHWSGSVPGTKMSRIRNISQKLPHQLIEQPDLPSSMYLIQQCLICRILDSTVSGGCLNQTESCFSVVVALLTTRLDFNHLLYWALSLDRDVYQIGWNVQGSCMWWGAGFGLTL